MDHKIKMGRIDHKKDNTVCYPFESALVHLKQGATVKRKIWRGDFRLIIGTPDGPMGKDEIFNISGRKLIAGSYLRYNFSQDDILAVDWILE